MLNGHFIIVLSRRCIVKTSRRFVDSSNLLCILCILLPSVQRGPVKEVRSQSQEADTRSQVPWLAHVSSPHVPTPTQNIRIKLYLIFLSLWYQRASSSFTNWLAPSFGWAITLKVCENALRFMYSLTCYSNNKSRLKDSCYITCKQWMMVNISNALFACWWILGWDKQRARGAPAQCRGTLLVTSNCTGK